MSVEIKLLEAGDEDLLNTVAPGVFDGPVVEAYAREFLNDPGHHLAVAIDRDAVVGMASAVHYIHPDKPPELWINEVGVAPTHRRRGFAGKLLNALFRAGESLGCREAWVLTHRSNQAAMKLYASAGGRPDPEDQVMFSFNLERETP